MRTIHPITLVALSTLLLACGGGGGDASGVPDAPIAINSQNAAAVAAVAVASSSLAPGTVGDGLGDLPLGVRIASGAPRFDVTAFVRREAERLAQSLVSGAVAPAVVGVVETLPCDSGSVRITFEEDPPFLSMFFNNCRDDEDGSVTRGSLTLRDVVTTGEPFLSGPWSLSASMVFGNLTFTGDGVTERIDGGVNFTSQSADNVVVSMTMTVASLLIADECATSRLRSYQALMVTDEATGVTTIEAGGRIASTLVGGSFELETVEPVVAIGDAHPHEGRVRLTGSNDSSVTVTFMDGGLVRLEIDEDGDGAAEDIIDTDVEALEESASDLLQC